MIRHGSYLCATIALLLSAACAASRGEGRQALRVLVFNIHAGTDAARQPNLERVATLIRSTRADLVLLQEVDRGTRRSGGADQLKVLGDLTEYHAAFGRSLDYDGGQYGIAVLARGTIQQHRTEPLPVIPAQSRAGGSYEPRAALMVDTSTRIGPLRAVNTHLDASRDEHYRLQESKHILLLASTLGESGLPVVAGGDFNAEPGSETHQQLLAGGFRDAWSECGSGDGFTYPADKPVKRIDYLFLTGGLSCSSAQVIDTQISDHRPLLVVVRR